MTLARQLLALQLLILLGVIVGVTAVSLAQSAEAVRRTEGRRALSAAENVAATPVVRDLLPVARPGEGSALPSAAESQRSLSGAVSVVLARPNGTVVTSSDPRQVGTRMRFGDAQVVRGRSWTGLVRAGGVTRVSAQVAVQNDTDGRVVGVAVVEREYPSTLQRLRAAVPNLVTYLGIAGGLGVLGSLLLAQRVQRQTLGLDPQLADVLTGRRTGTDQVVLVEDRVLTLNRNPVSSHGRVLGSVTTLRDRTELTTLRRELGVVRHATDTLRAQTHEFANQLHVISGLVQLREYDEVVGFIDAVSRGRAELDEDVTSRVADPALAALLVAKASLAGERGVELRFADGAGRGRASGRLGAGGSARGRRRHRGRGARQRPRRGARDRRPGVRPRLLDQAQRRRRGPGLRAGAHRAGLPPAGRRG